jgi:hypothetical protein
MQFERGKPPETPNAPYLAARIKDERWRSAGQGFEPGRAGPRLSFRSSQDLYFFFFIPGGNKSTRLFIAVLMKLRRVSAAHRRQGLRTGRASRRGERRRWEHAPGCTAAPHQRMRGESL